MPGSVLVVLYDTSSGKYLTRKVGAGEIADYAVVSGKLASAAVITVNITDGAVTSAKIASGFSTPPGDESVTSAKLASGAVIGDRVADAGIFSGKLASGSVAPWSVLGNAIIISSKIASGIIGGVHIKDASILSGQLGSGIIGDALVKDFGIISGKVASGVITEQNLASGISIDIAEISQEPSFRAGELISACQGVQFSASGYFGLAKVDDADTMPAVGIAIANLTSGSLGTFQHLGRITNANWDFSGYVGNLVFLGSGAGGTCEVSRTAPSLSGECVQRIGKIVSPTTVFLRPELVYVQLAE